MRLLLCLILKGKDFTSILLLEKENEKSASKLKLVLMWVEQRTFSDAMQEVKQ